MGASLTVDDCRTSAQKRATSGATGRIPAFDFTKGVLVLFMVLYHWLNYFYGVEGKIYNYLRFLTPSFIFITGFLISHVHFSKYGIGNSQLSKRLVLRGLKILGLFVLLNLMIGLLFPQSPIRTILFQHRSLAPLYAIFVSGNVYVDGSEKAAAFAILVPIGYLLIISACLSMVCKFFKYGFHVVCGMLLLSILILDLNHMHSVNLELLAIGLLGIVLGYASESEILRFVSYPYLAVFAYFVYLGAITIWEVPFPLRVVGVVLTVTLIYMVGAISRKPGRLGQHIVVLGKYSLFGYVSQIAILQVLHRILNHVNLGIGVLGLSFVAGFALTMMSVEIVDRVRPKSIALDRLYRTVFA